MHISLIGMGAGSPGHMTLDGVAALKKLDALIVLDKGEQKQDLLAVREEILSTHAPDLKILTIPDPPRDRQPADYHAEVVRWHQERSRRIMAEISQQLGSNPHVGFLVWGDPALYDSTLRVIEHLKPHCPEELTVTVYPGITAIAALTAAHAITLNRIGEAIHVTTGRNLPETADKDRRNCVVMLDGGAAWNEVATADTYIYWGAYLGLDQQVVREGYVRDIGDELALMKQQLRQQHGWIMDIYLLRELDDPAESTGV